MPEINNNKINIYVKRIDVLVKPKWIDTAQAQPKPNGELVKHSAEEVIKKLPKRKQEDYSAL